MIEVITKVGLFFLAAYLNSLAQIFFNKQVKKTYLRASYSPVNYLPIFQGILLPILTALFYYYPVGFTKNVKNTLLQETDHYLSKLFSLIVNLILSFFLLLLIKNNLFLVDFTGGLILQFAVINLLYVLFNIVPLYPSITSYWIIYKISAKKKNVENIYKSILYYKNAGIILISLLFLPDIFFWFLGKIQTHLYICLEMDNSWLIGITLFLTLLFSLLTLIHRQNLKKYYQELRQTLEKTLDEDKHSYDKP